MGCENIQSFTIPGALFAQIPPPPFFNFRSFWCNLLNKIRKCSQKKKNILYMQKSLKYICIYIILTFLWQLAYQISKCQSWHISWEVSLMDLLSS